MIFRHPDPATAAPCAAALLHIDVDVNGDLGAGDGDRQTVVMRVRGEIDIATAHVFSAALAFALRDAPREIAIDASRVTFFGAVGLSILLHARARAGELGTGLVLLAPAGNVLAVLELSGVDGTFPIRQHPRTTSGERPSG